jgi:hypothetical protein
MVNGFDFQITVRFWLRSPICSTRHQQQFHVVVWSMLTRKTLGTHPSPAVFLLFVVLQPCLLAVQLHPILCSMLMCVAAVVMLLTLQIAFQVCAILDDVVE